MARLSKKQKEARAKVDPKKIYSLLEEASNFGKRNYQYKI